ncbi:MAG: adenylate/guanylate cyclase domain-containing protein [Chthoniobacter sp.]|uniref:ATP-binding protein n=1 Tax=Chthoniobacter sp. TaxID=2510640 RepID=UPI0032ADCB86
MVTLPIGTITFLFSDIEGSSKKWEQHPDAMRVALAAHDKMLRAAFEGEGGYVFKTVGDAFCVAFDTALQALSGALQAQRDLRRMAWEGIEELKVRMAVHTGAAEHRDGDYFGQSLNRVARILASAHGGQVLFSLPAEELVRDHLPPGVQLRALGEHRLRDLARPEHLFQLVTSDLPSQFPALRSLESVPNNLPVQLTTFIGRERELGEVKRLLGSTRLLTLTGSGGTGKTRVSLQVGAELLEQFHDGVWFVEFATIDDGALVVETVAGLLDLRQEAERSLLTTLTSFLRNKQLLLILDNCEHVVAACARLAETLLRSCPQLRILASSREPLSIAGETAWPLPPLSLPNHWRDLGDGPDAFERLSEYEAVRLFIDRATLARPAFQPTNENIVTIAQICWRLDGIALAIELAAARIRVLTLQQIVERLDDRFHLLTTGSRTAVPRQQTLRSLIDWSHDLLSEPERVLFRRLSVFARGRTLESIEAICSDATLETWGIVDLLTQLVDKSLVYVEKEPVTGARYFMLESIWDYANEKLVNAGEADTFRVRHLDYFMAYAEKISPQLRGPQQKEWLDRAEQEAMNLRFGIETSQELPGEVAKGLRLMTAMQRFVEVKGLFKEAREHFGKLLVHPDASTRDLVRARAVAAAGRLAWIADEMPAVLALHTEALELFRELGDNRGVAQALADLAFHALDCLQDIPQAKKLLDEADALAQPLNEPRILAHIRHIRGVMAASEGDFAGAFALEEEGLSYYQQIGDTWLGIILAWNVGVNATVLGRFAEAHNRLSNCLRIGLELGNRWGASYPLEALATLAVAQRQYDRAARLFGAADAQRTRIGLVPQAADHPAMRAVFSQATDFHGPAIEQARAEGRSLSLDAAIALATRVE